MRSDSARTQGWSMMGYQLYSCTGSGWSISHDADAPPAKQWRIDHEHWGTYFFATHDEARDEAFRIAFENMHRASNRML
jgi:hypothetical protein